MESKPKVRVLFLCVHNTARSQMAEGLLRHLADDRFEVESAGFDPRPLNLLAVEAMRQYGIDISQAKSKEVFALARAGRHFHYVIAVCDESTSERCPIFPGVAMRLTWSFPDPALFDGSDMERLQKVAALRDAIGHRVEEWLREVAREAENRQR